MAFFFLTLFASAAHNARMLYFFFFGTGLGEMRDLGIRFVRSIEFRFSLTGLRRIKIVVLF